jgi:hypothetical protein
MWLRPRVKVGGLYPMEDGCVFIESIREIGFDEVTHGLALESGFLGVVDLMKTARHGRGERLYLIEFHFLNISP